MLYHRIFLSQASTIVLIQETCLRYFLYYLLLRVCALCTDEYVSHDGDHLISIKY
jgi:hypothetical protein